MCGLVIVLADGLRVVVGGYAGMVPEHGTGRPVQLYSLIVPGSLSESQSVFSVTLNEITAEGTVYEGWPDSWMGPYRR